MAVPDKSTQECPQEQMADNLGFLYKEKVGKVELDGDNIGSLGSLIRPHLNQKQSNPVTLSSDSQSTDSSSLASRNQFLCKILNSQSEKLKSTSQHSKILENVSHSVPGSGDLLLKHNGQKLSANHLTPKMETQDVRPQSNFHEISKNVGANFASNIVSYKPETHTFSNSNTSHLVSQTVSQVECMDLSKIPGSHDITYDPTRLWVNTNKISLSSSASTVSSSHQKEYLDQGDIDISKLKKYHSSVNFREMKTLQDLVEAPISLPSSIRDFTEEEAVSKSPSNSLDVTVNSSVDSNDCKLSDDDSHDPFTSGTNLIEMVINQASQKETEQVPKMNVSRWFQSSVSGNRGRIDFRKNLLDIMSCLKYLHIEFEISMINDSPQIVMQNMCNLGDKFVTNLVSWTRHLPFYCEVPIQLHSKLLTAKWHKLLLLLMSAQQVQSGNQTSMTFEEFYQQKLTNVKSCLNKLFSKNLQSEKMSSQMNSFIRHICRCMFTFNCMSLMKEEYACLQIILLLDQGETLHNQGV